MSPTTKRFQITFGKVALFIALLGIGAGCGIGYLAYRFVTREFPDVAVLNSRFPVVHYQGPKLPVKTTLSHSRPPGWVSIRDVSKAALGAVVVSEDWAFFSHDGYDAKQLKEAIQEDLSERKFSRGASTITMQVVKNVFLSQEKTLYRKGKEFILAIRLTGVVPKRKVLEVYFNIAEWGEGIFGIGRASQFYFGKPASELNPREGAFLAMLLPSPKKYSQSFRDRNLTKYASKTVSDILDKMAQAHYITEEERDTAKKSRMSFEQSLPAASENNLGTEPLPDSEESDPETPRELDLEGVGGENT
ncbi:MAG: transglycosylase domain-containing protein [Cryobacterium sp.]|nr:transglycosylase domain-containing protein [Oligoflexia bacterium]